MLFSCTFILVCLALSADFRLGETSRLPLRPEPDTAPITSNTEQAPGDYSFPDYFVRWFTNSRQSKLENSAPFGERSIDEADIMKRQEENLDDINSFDTKSDEKKRKPGCKIIFWKSWTDC